MSDTVRQCCVARLMPVLLAALLAMVMISGARAGQQLSAPTTQTPPTTPRQQSTPTPQAPTTAKPATQTPTTQSSSPQSSPPPPSQAPTTTAPQPSTTPSATTPQPGTLGAPTVPLSPAQSGVVPAPSSNTSAVAPLSRDEAIQLALRQASTFQQAQLNERIAAEDVRQARIAFLPRLNLPSSFIYNSPALISTPTAQNTPRPPSFIGANAVTEYQGLAGIAGEVDTSGRLRATLRRNQALLESARAGTNVARRALVLATEEAYYNLAFAAARRSSAEQNLANAAEFERVTSLLLKGGEVAPVDLVRARLQTTQRRNELEAALADEAAAEDSLRVLVGYDFSAPIAVSDLLMMTPAPGELDRFDAAMIARRPEFTQFEAERRAAEQDLQLARAERRPQLIYSINGGFDADSLRATPLRDHTGVSANIGFTLPILDFGASRSRALQATLRAQTVQSSLALAQRTFAQAFYTARKQALLAITRINIARAGIADAESNINASIARYRAGEAQIIEVTDAQNALIAQRTALYQAIFDYQTARARLAQATGQ